MDDVVDKEMLYQLMSVEIETAKEDEEVLKRLKMIDLTKVFKDSPGLNQSFNCSLLIERNAWISKSDKGDYRYYSKLKESLFSFDIIDLLTIFRNETLKSTLTFIQDKWNLSGLTEWYLKQRYKHTTNASTIKSIKKKTNEFPSLNKLLGKNWSILETINDYSLQKITNEELAIGDKAVFFFSGNYIKKEYFPKKSLSTINNLVNLICLLGFIEKIPLNEIPKKMSQRLEIIHRRRKLMNHTSYYSIALFPQILEEAERKASVLLSEGIYYHKLTKRVVIELFGQDVHNQVYIQKTTANRRKEVPVYFAEQNESYTEYDRLIRKFNECIERYGFCEKTKLKEFSLLSRDRFNKAWKSMVADNNCIEKYPNKEEMKNFNISTRRIVACPR